MIESQHERKKREWMRLRLKPAPAKVLALDLPLFRDAEVRIKWSTFRALCFFSLQHTLSPAARLLPSGSGHEGYRSLEHSTPEHSTPVYVSVVSQTRAEYTSSLSGILLLQIHPWESSNKAGADGHELVPRLLGY